MMTQTLTEVTRSSPAVLAGEGDRRPVVSVALPNLVRVVDTEIKRCCDSDGGGHWFALLTLACGHYRVSMDTETRNGALVGCLATDCGGVA